MVPNEMKRYWIKDMQAHKQPGWPQTTLIQLTSLQTFIMQCNFSKENSINWRVLNLIYVSLIFNVSESENILLTGYQVTWSHSRLEWSCCERERERERERENERERLSQSARNSFLIFWNHKIFASFDGYFCFNERYFSPKASKPGTEFYLDSMWHYSAATCCNSI